MTRLVIAFGAALLLAGCAGQAAQVTKDTAVATTDVSKVTADANEALAIAQAAFAVYKASPNPAPAVVAEGNKLEAEAQAAIAQYGPEATTAITAAGSLLAYLLTSAPGNGITPSTVPTAPAAP
jgi:hypothetical protein